VREAAMLHSSHAPTYLYYFSHVKDFTLAPILSATATSGGPFSFFFNFNLFKEITN
jgi:hypothetical protein